MYKQKTVVRATVEALFEILTEKCGVGSNLVWKTESTARDLTRPRPQGPGEFNEARTVEATQLIDNSHMLCSSSADGNASEVAILVALEHIRCVHAVHVVSDRVIAIDLSLHGRMIHVIAVYIPHSDCPLPFIDDVYQQVSPLSRQAQCRYMRIIGCGDFNISLDSAPHSCLFSDWIPEFDLQLYNL